MINRLSFSDWVRGLLDLFLPRECVVCGKRLPLRERHVCLDCLADLPRTFYSKMSRNPMADRLNEMIQRNLQPEAKPRPYSFATALFYYRASTGYRNITKSLKYGGNIALGRYFASMLSEEMARSPLYADIDTVIPVPLHWTRRWSRGYNQAEIIAFELAKTLGAEVRTDIIRRRRRTRTQTRLSIGEKAANVAGAFVLKKRANLDGCSHILIVDDVLTTGATVHSCLKILMDNTKPSVRISVATLACVGY